MDFIYTYFNTKIRALGTLCEATKLVWDARIWLAFVLMVLWTMFCTIGGILLLPIDVIYCAIMWYKNEDAREIMKAIMEEVTLNQECFLEEEES